MTIINQTAIAAALDRYLGAARKGDSAAMRADFDDEATIQGFIDGELFGGPILGLFEWIDQNPPAAALQAQITHIDIAGSVATARIEIEDWGGHRFTDMFTLIKKRNRWLIVSKVFHLHAA